MTSQVNPRPPGGPGFPRPAGRGVFEHPPSNSAPGPRSDTEKAAFERMSKIRKTSLNHFFGQVKGQVTRGH